MKLTRLDSTTQHLAPEAVERAQHAADHGQRRVEAMEGVAGARQRSLQQEIADGDAPELAPCAGSAQALENARQVAAELSGRGVRGLVKWPAGLALSRIDDKV